MTLRVAAVALGATRPQTAGTDPRRTTRPTVAVALGATPANNSQLSFFPSHRTAFAGRRRLSSSLIRDQILSLSYYLR